MLERDFKASSSFYASRSYLISKVSPPLIFDVLKPLIGDRSSRLRLLDFTFSGDVFGDLAGDLVGPGETCSLSSSSRMFLTFPDDGELVMIASFFSFDTMFNLNLI